MKINVEPCRKVHLAQVLVLNLRVVGCSLVVAGQDDGAALCDVDHVSLLHHRMHSDYRRR